MLRTHAMPLVALGLVLASPVTSQSSNVAIISSPVITNGGTLPTSGGAFGAFTFTNLSVANVNAANLAAFDTVVLNVASSEMRCTTSTLSASQKTDLNAFVSGGGKLIIYDSECTFGGSVDYSWLTYPFSTVNPGAQGAFGGTLTIFEENALSSNMMANPKFIDTNAITTQTDAVGDMNVVDLSTVHPNWCLDMTGTNVLNFTGAVHMYARLGAGLMIYNGLDVDFMSSSVSSSGGGQLVKIWLQELQTGFSGAELPCGISVAGISLTPPSAVNNVGSSHTVTAKVTSLGTPIPGALVTFTILSGPNMGASGVCSPASCMTDANGEVTFTYVGSGGLGTDRIQASFVDMGVTKTSPIVTKEWIECLLLLGAQQTASPCMPWLPGNPDYLYTQPLMAWDVTIGNCPQFTVPSMPGLVGATLYAQVGMLNFPAYPHDPLQLSQGLAVTIGSGAVSYGQSSGINAWLTGQPNVGSTFSFDFSIQ